MDIQFEKIEYEKAPTFDETPWVSDSSYEHIGVADQLRNLVDPELILGSISPASVEKYNEYFNQFGLLGLNSLSTEYLTQWAQLFIFACKK